MRPLRLLFVTTVAATSDAFLEETAQEAAGRGWRVQLATNLETADARDRPYEQIHHVNWGRGFASPLGTARAVSELRSVLLAQRFDIVHTHTPTASSITRLVARTLPRRLRPKIIYTAHGFHFGEALHGVTPAIARLTESTLLPWTDVLIVINSEDETWARRASGKRTSVLRTKGVGIRDTFLDNPPGGTGVRDEWGIEPDAFVASVIGELIPRKRPELAIEAVAAMGGADRHLLVIGGGPLEEQLKHQAEQLTSRDRTFHAHFLAHRNDIPQCLAASNVLVHPAAQEGLPTVVLEAMAMGIPVAAFDLRGSHDLLSTGAGAMVPNGDVAALTAALRDLRSSPALAGSMGAEGRRLASGYVRTELAAQMCDVYAAVAAGRRVGRPVTEKAETGQAL
jgi:glycosyltransferase involved in cell wall biosynthesis